MPKSLNTIGYQNIIMRLIQQEHSEYKGKKYCKSWIVIPQKIIEKLKWKKGEKLEAGIKGDKLIIEKD